VRVLQLYTSTRSFFESQIRALEAVGVECTALGVPGEFEPGSYRSLTDYLRYAPQVLDHSLDGYDVVHANWGLLGPFALAQPTRPVVLTLWGSDVMSDRRWLTETSRFSARHADATVLPSEAMRPALDGAGEQFHVPFGVDLDRFRPLDREAARERVGWTTDDPVALFPYDPSRPEKGYDRAERVVERADVDVDLRTVTGVPHDRMPDYMNASDVLLVTSRRESGPMVVKEAAACDVPVVSTDVGFVRETLSSVSHTYVRDEEAALAEALESAIEGPRRSDARATLEGLGLETMGERLAGVYERVLAERGR
jgi:glycosyltransferase involved in cell wall biosynthesis